ncbi:MAG: MobF family relaxase [Acidimicrobiales bacterium]
MMKVRKIGSGAVGYYFGEDRAGRWVGAGARRLGLDGVVTAVELRSVLEGRHPLHGGFLPARRPARRRAGWDLILAAPKSLSLLVAMAPADAPAATAAHRAAVDEVCGHLEWQLSGPDGDVPGHAIAAAGSDPGLSGGIVAADFVHISNASGEPHLHSHVILANLRSSATGPWSALGGRWWTEKDSLGALYQLGLRRHLASLGLDLPWRLRPDGLADLAPVPRAAVRAASTRSRDAAADRGSRSSRRRALEQPWLTRSSAAGFGPSEAAVLGHARGRPAGTPSTAPVTTSVTDRAVTVWLAGRRSAFRHADVITALGSCLPEGATAPEARAWADRFCSASIPVASPTSVPRWTTPAAARADSHLVAMATSTGSHPVAGRGYRPPAQAQVDAAVAAHPELSAAGRAAALRLMCDDRGVEVLRAKPGRTNLLACAAVLDTARMGWQTAGHSVALVTRTPDSASRWAALAGLGHAGAGQASLPGAGLTGAEAGHPAVVVVDQADRLATPRLISILDDAQGAGTKVVLVEGGTLPRMTWVCSAGLADLDAHRGGLDPTLVDSWGVPDLPGSCRDSPGRARPGVVGPDQETIRCGTGHDAARLLVGVWDRQWAGPAPAMLVGLGPAEAAGLNRAARDVLAREGSLLGPLLDLPGGRRLQAGDRVVALARLSGAVPFGSLGWVVQVQPDRGSATVRWPGAVTALDRWVLSRVGHGYAVTPAVAARMADPLLLLGRPEALGADRARILAAAVAAPDLGPAHDLVRQELPPAPARSPERSESTERRRRNHLGIGFG